MERENIGVELYGTQQELARLQGGLESFHDKYAKASDNHKQQEDQLNATQVQYKKTLDAVNNERRKCKFLQLVGIH